MDLNPDKKSPTATQPHREPIRGWTFAEYVLDEGHQCLIRHGHVQHLPAKEFGLLRLLAQSEGGILDRLCLLDTLWPGETVSDAALTKVVQKARERLEAPNDSVIRTVYKAGYQLMPKCERIGAESQVTALDILPIGLAIQRMAAHVASVPLPVLRSTLEVAAICCQRGQHAEMLKIFNAASLRLRDSHGPQFALTQFADFHIAECRLRDGESGDEILRLVASMRAHALSNIVASEDWDRRIAALRLRLIQCRRDSQLGYRRRSMATCASSWSVLSTSAATRAR